MVLVCDSGRVECLFQFLFSGVWNSGRVEEVLAGVPPDAVPQWEDSCFVVHSPLWHSPGKSEGKSESCTFHCSKPLHLARGQAEKGLRPKQKSASNQTQGQMHKGLPFLPPGFAPHCSQEVQCLSYIGDGSVYLLCPVSITLEGDPEVMHGIGSFYGCPLDVDLQVVWWAHSL